MLTTAGATCLTTGAKVRLICWGEVGTVSCCASAGAADRAAAAIKPIRAIQSRIASLQSAMPAPTRGRKRAPRQHGNKKGSRQAAALLGVLCPNPLRLRDLGLGGFALGLFLGLDRTGILALGSRIAVHELDDRHRGHVAVAEARLQHAGVAAVAALVAVGQRGQQLVRQLVVLERGEDLPAGGKAALL